MIDLLLATLITTFPIEHLHDARALRASGVVRDLASLGGDDFIIASGPPDEWDGRELMRVHGEQVTPLLALPPTRPGVCRGSRLVTAAEGRWWFFRCNDEKVEFVTSSAPSRVSEVSVPERTFGVAPLAGDQPAVVVVAPASPPEQLMKAELVTASGRRPLGEFERSGHIAYFPTTWQAHRIDEKTIAVVSLEQGDRDANDIVLRVFREEGEMTESRLPFLRNRYVAVASAYGEHGMAVVASTPTGGGLVSMVFDPNTNEPRTAKPIDIKGSDAQRLAHSGSQIVPLGERFAVAWINMNDRGVRMSEFDRTMALPAARVADDTDEQGEGPMLRQEEEGVSVFWSHGAPMQRTLPAEAAGYLFATELWKRLGVRRP
jgi:hypothetical protein